MVNPRGILCKIEKALIQYKPDPILLASFYNLPKQYLIDALSRRIVRGTQKHQIQIPGQFLQIPGRQCEMILLPLFMETNLTADCTQRFLIFRKRGSTQKRLLWFFRKYQRINQIRRPVSTDNIVRRNRLPFCRRLPQFSAKRIRIGRHFQNALLQCLNIWRSPLR